MEFCVHPLITDEKTQQAHAVAHENPVDDVLQAHDGRPNDARQGISAKLPETNAD